MGAEQKEAQARSVGRQQLDVGLLEGEVSQDDGDLQHPLGLHVADALVSRRVEEALPAISTRAVCADNTGGGPSEPPGVWTRTDTDAQPPPAVCVCVCDSTKTSAHLSQS